jgi:hypothetical protein
MVTLSVVWWLDRNELPCRTDGQPCVNPLWTRWFAARNTPGVVLVVPDTEEHGRQSAFRRSLVAFLKNPEASPERLTIRIGC